MVFVVEAALQPHAIEQVKYFLQPHTTNDLPPGSGNDLGHKPVTFLSASHFPSLARSRAVGSAKKNRVKVLPFSAANSRSMRRLSLRCRSADSGNSVSMSRHLKSSRLRNLLARVRTAMSLPELNRSKAPQITVSSSARYASASSPPDW